MVAPITMAVTHPVTPTHAHADREADGSQVRRARTDLLEPPRKDQAVRTASHKVSPQGAIGESRLAGERGERMGRAEPRYMSY